MAGEKNLSRLLADLQPRLLEGTFTFCSVPVREGRDFLDLEPIACFFEEEGLTLVLPEARARSAGFACDTPFRCIALMVHSSLEAVGLTAAVSGQLAAAGISANVMAAYHHDYVFVPADRADLAVKLLRALSKDR